MEETPTTLDWVTARAECSVAHLFVLLREVADSDVKAIQTRRTDAVFRLQRPTDKKFIVSHAVLFEHTPQGIVASLVREERPLFVAKPSLSGSGQCRLDIDGQSLELWQVSRRALEDLFFGF